MKRNIFAFSVLAMAAMVFLSCDFLRSVAGRPTSAELDLKRARIEEKERLIDEAMKEQQRNEQAERDSIAVASRIDSLGLKMNPVSKILSSLQEPLAARYYIVIGSFQDWNNAERQLLAAELAGFEGDIVKYRSGSSAVVICPSNDLVTVYREYEKVRNCAFCPPDAWLLINE